MDVLFLDRLGAPVWMWLAFAGLLISLLAFDLGVLNRRDHEIGVRESLLLSTVYIGLGLAFGFVVWRRLGPDAGLAYLTGYIVEKTLSLDNVFVIAMIFLSFSVPKAYQHRVLFWGILFAIALRGLLIGFGAALIANFAWTLYVFSAVLIATGLKTLFYTSEKTDAVDNAFMRFLRARLNVTKELRGNRFFVRLPHPKTNAPTLYVTPLFLALVSIEIADVVFAVDSVPAIFAITTDPFIVYTSNIFAILGLRALFFALSAVMERVRYLEQTLALVLIFIGSKIFVADMLGEEIPPWLSLVGSVTIIAAGGAYSLWRTQPAARRWMPRLAAVVATVSVFGLGFTFWPQREEPTGHYETAIVERGAVIRSVSATGVIERAPVRVFSAAPGKIATLACAVGDRVTAGQVCASLDEGPYVLRLEREKKSLAAASARRDAAEAERGRASRKARARHEQALARAEAELRRRLAALSAAEADLARTRIVAPVDGVVLSREAAVGRRVGDDKNKPLFVVAPDAVTLRIAGAAGLDEVEVGDRVSFSDESAPEKLFEGAVDAILRPPHAGAGGSVSVGASDPGRLLRDGTKAMAVIIVDRRADVLRIANRAIGYAKARAAAGEAPTEGWVKLWALRDGEPKPIPVRLGLDDGVYTEIVAGDLRPGDRLIVGDGASAAAS